MKTKHYLTLSDAEILLEQAQQVASEMGLNVSISVVDETGCLLTMKRLDGASLQKELVQSVRVLN